MSVYVILNPASNSGGGGKMLPVLERKLEARGIEYELHATEAPGHAEELAARAARQGVERVLAVGGDGTIHEVANGFLVEQGVPPALGVVPLGTGNDFYRMVGAPKDPDAALDTLERGEAKPFDVGLVEFDGQRRHFVNLLGIGIDVEVLRRRERVRRLKGLAQYLVALLGAMVGFRAVPIRVRMGDSVLDGPSMLAAITVGPSAGGGFILCPGATPDDGELDLCFFRDLNYLQILRYIPKVIRGTHGEGPLVELRRFREAEMESPRWESLLFPDRRRAREDSDPIPSGVRSCPVVSGCSCPPREEPPEDRQRSGGATCPYTSERGDRRSGRMDRDHPMERCRRPDPRLDPGR